MVEPPHFSFSSIQKAFIQHPTMCQRLRAKVKMRTISALKELAFLHFAGKEKKPREFK